MLAALVFFLVAHRWNHPFMLLGHPPALIRAWFDNAADIRQAKATITRRAYRAGVRAWCA